MGLRVTPLRSYYEQASLDINSAHVYIEAERNFHRQQKLFEVAEVLGKDTHLCTSSVN